MNSKREEIYNKIEKEREYQDEMWGDLVDDRSHSVSDWILFMETHLENAKSGIYELDKSHSLDEIRKIAALCVACAEFHGMPDRK